MSTLTALFDQHRPQLQQRLRDEHSPEPVIREVKNWLGSLLTLAAREKNRTLTERRVLGFLLDVVNAGVTTLASCEVVTGEGRSASRTSAATSRGDWFLRVVRVIVAAALGSTLYLNENFSALALLVVLVLLDVREWFV